MTLRDFLITTMDQLVLEALRCAGAPLGHAMRSHKDPLQRSVLVLKREVDDPR